ncbi:MAG TPA: phosphatase PAP2 family protein [Actinomycetes bacterium]|jgi:undecaprenyl-diphosphatase|nr:phosphatase PAP2 family protein [Actinomycetes bacterium]
MKAARGHGPLDPSWRDPEATLAERWRHLRDGVPSALFLVGGAVVLLGVLVLLGFLLTNVANDDALGNADSSLSRWFAAHRSEDMNEVTRWTTTLGGTLPVATMAVLVVAGAALAWRRWREPMLVAVAVAGEVVIFLGVTMLVDRARPPVKHLDEAPPTSSFPSGHTAAAIALYGAVAILASERARSAALRWLFVALALAIPLVVAVSRVYRGMHYLSDVVGGILLGAIWLFLTVKAVRLGVLHHQLRKRSPDRPQGAPARGGSAR